MTTNILEHFSFKKYRGNIYRNLTWGDDEAATILDGDTYVLASKILTLTNNFLLTINSGVTLYVQGTLVIGSNVTITGGGKIVTSGGVIKTESTTSLATAFNNSRKVVQDASGNHHIVFDASGEICYEKWANNSTELKEFKRLSGSNGNNAYACIAERGGRLYVVWQRKDGTTTTYTSARARTAERHGILLQNFSPISAKAPCCLSSPARPRTNSWSCAAAGPAPRCAIVPPMMTASIGLREPLYLPAIAAMVSPRLRPPPPTPAARAKLWLIRAHHRQRFTIATTCTARTAPVGMLQCEISQQSCREVIALIYGLRLRRAARAQTNDSMSRGKPLAQETFVSSFIVKQRTGIPGPASFP